MIRESLLAYCEQDTWAMVRLLQRLRRVSGQRWSVGRLFLQVRGASHLGIEGTVLRLRPSPAPSPRPFRSSRGRRIIPPVVARTLAQFPRGWTDRR